MASAGTQAQALDWHRLMKGKVLEPDRVQELTEVITTLIGDDLAGRRCNYRRLAQTLNVAGLAEVLRGCDPARPSTEDKLQAVINLVGAFEPVGPALVYGGLHEAVFDLRNRAERDWESHALCLRLLRFLLEACTTGPAGVDPLNVDGAIGMAAVFAGHLQQMEEQGVTPERGQGIDDCLEGLYSLTRYRGHPASEAAKQVLWEVEAAMTMLDIAQVPASDWGYTEVGQYTEGLRHFLDTKVNTARVLCMLMQVPGPPFETLQMYGELLRREGIFDGLKALVQTACDLMYTDTYACAYDGQAQEAGATLLRNTLSLLGNGVLWVHHSAITDLKHAGWEPLLQQIKADRTYQGHYRQFFRRFADTLLARLASWKGRTDKEAMRLGQELFELMPLSVPRDADLTEAQMVGPTGEHMEVIEVSMVTKDYTKYCAACGKEEAELQQQQEAAGSSAGGDGAGSSRGSGSASADAAAAAGGSGGQNKLRECSGCHRVRYCSRKCQKQHWLDHKAECKRYQKRQAAGGSQPAEE